MQLLPHLWYPYGRYFIVDSGGLQAGGRLLSSKVICCLSAIRELLQPLHASMIGLAAWLQGSARLTGIHATCNFSTTLLLQESEQVHQEES